MLYAIVVVLILILDQLMKYYTTLRIGTEAVSLIPNFISLTKVYNTGAAFNILQDSRWLLVGIALVCSIIIAYLINRQIIRGTFGRWSAVLVIAGALGNGIDRVIRGHVVDMFQFDFFPSFPVFNVADIFITCGGILFCIYILTAKDSVDENSSRASRRTKAKQPEAVITNQPTANIETISKPNVRPSDLSRNRSGADRRQTAAQPQQQQQQGRQPARPRQQGSPQPQQQQRQTPAAQGNTQQQTPSPAPSAASRQPAAAPRRTPEQRTQRPASGAAPSTPAPRRREVDVAAPDFTLEDILAEFRDDD